MLSSTRPSIPGRFPRRDEAPDCLWNNRSDFELVINLNAAKALGTEVSPKLLALADEVIE